MRCPAHLCRRKSVLALLTFFAWTFLFGSCLPYRPRFVIQTDAKYVPIHTIRDESIYAAIEDLSTDGRHVTIRVVGGDFRFPATLRIETWDTWTGETVTPALRDDPGWRELINVPGGG